MPYPTLISPVSVVIEPLDRTNTVYDEDAREPIGRATRGSQITFQAQVNETAEEVPTMSELGVAESTRGYISISQKELADKGIELKRGDRIVKIGNRDVDYYLIYFANRAHWSDIGGSGLLKAWYADRHPGEQRGLL